MEVCCHLEFVLAAASLDLGCEVRGLHEADHLVYGLILGRDVGTAQVVRVEQLVV